MDDFTLVKTSKTKIDQQIRNGQHNQIVLNTTLFGVEVVTERKKIFASGVSK